MKSRDILIWLNNLRGINNRYIEYLDDSFEDLSDVWNMNPAEIMKIDGIGKTLKESMVSNRSEKLYEKIIETAQKKGIDIITIRDREYPNSLRTIPDAPRVLYVKGKLEKRDEISISIVGPRKASGYGLWVAETLSREISRLGITVVSGMALGVDAASHMASLDAGGRTIAVLGTGADVVYPSKNRHIYERIVKSGAVISEFPLGSKGLPYRFPQRNRIVSGLSLGTVIIEAGERSGTLTTVQHGLDQGKDIFAVPGNINSVYSRGTNTLIQDGAKLVKGVDDILCEISELKSILEKSETRKEVSLSDVEKKIVEMIALEPQGIESIAVESGQTVSSVMGILTVLELKGKVRKTKGGIFTVV